MTNRIVALTSVLSLVAFFVSVTPTYGGCGCDKPPPPVASVRPAFASPGNTVTLFAPGIQDGVSYLVLFVSRVRRSSAADLCDGHDPPRFC